MSVVDHQGKPAETPRDRQYGFWWLVASKVRGDEKHRWRRLAALCLYEVCQWPAEPIGVVLGVHKGQVSRLINAAREELRESTSADELRSAIRADEAAAVDDLRLLVCEDDGRAA